MKSLIKNRDRVKQVIDFTGVQNGKMHPSDVDAVLEFDNEALILMEVKYKFNKIPRGQKLLLERIADRWGEKAIVLKIEHNFNNDKLNIPLNECEVTQIYYNKKWTIIDNTNLIEYLNKLGNSWNIKKCKF
tara:strand:- start:943 stop:1335 length:393 start_codon:yes stop_codon:yes gene_type:complete